MRSLILSSVKGLAIPGTILKLRNYAMVFTLAATFVSIYEAMRFSFKFGPLPESDPQVLMWVLLCLAGSLIGTIGTFLLHKGMLLAAALIFCCGLAPVTPNMIVLTQGDQYQYFIGLTIFWLALGGLEISLFTHLADEMR